MAIPDDIGEREVVIGAGVHGMVYAATRVSMGFPKPLVLEKEDRPGGTFARLTVPFWLNSVNEGSITSTSEGPTRIRPLTPEDDLNWLPNAPFQVAAACMTEYPSSSLVGDVIRKSLRRVADVVTSCDVTVTNGFTTTPVVSVNGRVYTCKRLIDARGLKPVIPAGAKAGTCVITGDDFLRGLWPEGMADGKPKRIALIGGGDTARIVAEALLGQSPGGRVPVNCAEIGWYATDGFPLTKQQAFTNFQARYLGLARHFPQASSTSAAVFNGGMIRPYAERASAASLGSRARVNGQNYDLAVTCTGYEPAFSNAEDGPSIYEQGAGLWREYGSYYIVGPAARMEYRSSEMQFGYTRFPQNVAAILRLAPETARLAASLPALS